MRVNTWGILRTLSKQNKAQEWLAVCILNDLITYPNIQVVVCRIDSSSQNAAFTPGSFHLHSYPTRAVVKMPSGTGEPPLQRLILLPLPDVKRPQLTWTLILPGCLQPQSCSQGSIARNAHPNCTPELSLSLTSFLNPTAFLSWELGINADTTSIPLHLQFNVLFSCQNRFL